MLLSTLVIGYSKSAVQYAYTKDLPIIINSQAIPKFFEDHLESWSNCLFHLSIQGKVLFGDSVKSVRFEGNTATVVHGTKSTKIKFDKCIVYNDDNLFLENEIVDSKTMKSMVLDWINVRSCSEHSVDKLSTESDFVKDAYFYKSKRISGNHNKRDVVSISYLTAEELASFDFSDTMARFKVEKLMIQNGISGASRGANKITKKSYPRKIKLEVSKREVYHLTVNSYKDSEFVSFM